LTGFDFREFNFLDIHLQHLPYLGHTERHPLAPLATTGRDGEVTCESTIAGLGWRRNAYNMVLHKYVYSGLRVVVDTHLKEIADDGGFELRLCPTILPPNLPLYM